MRSTHVARCPVTLFEAIVAGPWRLCPAIGELQVHEAKGKLVFQLHDLLDGQVLFQTTRPPSAYYQLAERFHVIKQENGTYRGLGFSDASAAAEVSDFVALHSTPLEGGVPFEPQQTPPSSSKVAKVLFASGRREEIELGSPPPILRKFRSKSGPLRTSDEQLGVSSHFPRTSSSGTPSPGTSPASVLSVSSDAHGCRSISLPKESTASVPIPATPRAKSIPVLGTPRLSQGSSPRSDTLSEVSPNSCSFSPGKTKSVVRARLQRILSGRDRFDGPDMEIGYPYNVQHEGHIGWTPPPSTSESAWIDSPSTSSFVSPPLSSFGSPSSDELGGDWIAPTPHADFRPPATPPDYVDEPPLTEPASPSPVTPTKAKRTFSFSRRRNRTQPQTLTKL